MNLLKKYLFLFIFLFPFGFSFSQNYNLADDFLLVESVPVETILENSTLPRTIDVWLDMFNNAKKSVDIEMFYFASQKGGILEKVFEALKNAASRDVLVRIIVDSSFYSRSEHSVDELEGIKNITIRKIPYGNLGGGVMHAKYFLVDGESMFLGSQNMDWRALMHIHEIGVKIKDNAFVSTFQKIFDLDWRYCLSDNNAYFDSLNNKSAGIVNSENPAIVLTGYYGEIKLFPSFSPFDYTPKNFSCEFDEILKLVQKSKERLFIQIYSFSVKSKGEKKIFASLSDEIKNAASRGVDVKIILPDWAMKKDAVKFIKNLSEVKNIQIKISSIPEYSGGFIPYSRVEHCKYFISDDNISFVSTSNWEYDYFYNSRNASVVINNTKVNSDLYEVFMRDWNGPYTELVDVNKDYKPPKRN
jgi:phospholipase D3/4